MSSDHNTRRAAAPADEGMIPASQDSFVLDPRDLNRLNARLRGLGWDADGPVLGAERIGDGNMNMTVRARTPRGSFILKQAMPWVVKYPQIPAPVERAAVEASFYRTVENVPEVARRMPRLLGFDAGSHLLRLEDMGDGGDLTGLYRSGAISSQDCATLTAYLNALHRVRIPEQGRGAFSNRAMRALNHEHQYRFPLLADNGLALNAVTPGLAERAKRMIADKQYCDRVAEIGRIYLSDGATLVHGDFFPGSWLRSGAGLAVIDPEFCFLGAAEYDLGVFLAHLELVDASSLWPQVISQYEGSVDWALAKAFAGAEIMRRLIGVAQLPLPASLERKSAWLDLSRELVCGS